MARALLVSRRYSPLFFPSSPRLPPLLHRRASPPLRFLSSSSSPSSVSTTSHSPSDGGCRKREGDGKSGYNDYLGMSDDELMGQCEMGTFKASGPGGQHRNKRESAVRLRHRPTGIIAQGMQALLDLLFAVEGSVSEAAKIVGLSTGALSRLILSDDSLRTAANELRASKVPSGSELSWFLGMPWGIIPFPFVQGMGIYLGLPYAGPICQLVAELCDLVLSYIGKNVIQHSSTIFFRGIYLSNLPPKG